MSGKKRKSRHGRQWAWAPPEPQFSYWTKFTSQRILLLCHSLNLLSSSHSGQTNVPGLARIGKKGENALGPCSLLRIINNTQNTGHKHQKRCTRGPGNSSKEDRVFGGEWVKPGHEEGSEWEFGEENWAWAKIGRVWAPTYHIGHVEEKGRKTLGKVVWGLGVGDNKSHSEDLVFA